MSSTILPPPRGPALFASAQGALVWWSGSGPALVPHHVDTGDAAALAPLSAPAVGRVLQVEQVGDVVVVRDDVSFRGHDAMSGAPSWRTMNRTNSVIADVIGERLVLVGHEGEELAVSFLSPGDGALEPIALLDETMRYSERRFARRGALLRFVTDRRALVTIDLAARAVVGRSPLPADRVRPIVSAAGRPFLAWTRDGVSGPVTTVVAVDEDGALREEAMIDGECTAFEASARVLAVEVLRSPVHGPRRVHAWLAGDFTSALALRGGGRLFPAGERMVVVNEEAANVVEPRGGGVEVFGVRLPQDALFIGGRALLPSERALASIDLRALPPAPTSGHAPMPQRPARANDVILPPPREASGEHRRLDPLDAARALEERGVKVAPLYDWLVRLYYGDGVFRWRFESLGLVLRDPRRPWLGDEPSFVVFAEGEDGALYAFEGAVVVRVDPATRVTSPFAPSFDAFLARVLARADRPGALEMVLATLGLDSSFVDRA